MGELPRDLSAFVTPLENDIRHMELAVEGVSCAGCMRKIEAGLAAVPGVTRARLNFTNRRLSVDWQAGMLRPEEIVARLDGLGYRAHPFDPGAEGAAETRESKALLRALAVAGFATANIMLLSVAVWSGNVTDITPELRDLFHWISALIAIPVVAYSGQPFFRSALAALKVGRVNMDVPISLGVLLAVSMSLAETFTGGRHAYFDAAVMLLFFLLIGRYLNMEMRRRTRAHAENLAALKGETALKLLPGGGTRLVPLSAVDPGDRVLVAAGERLSVDGVVEAGRSEIDQSFVTGETSLADVGPGDSVYAGSLNAAGALTIRVTAAAAGTLLDEVEKLLAAAQDARSARLALADRAVRYYAPLVHTAAALTFLGWMLAGASWQSALTTAIALLIITCPCALGLAIPAVQVVASGLLFRAGVLLNAGEAVERLAEVDTVVFDKTGTLTTPEPTIANLADISPDVLDMAARLALSSRHPMATALGVHADGHLPLDGAVEEAGRGVRVEIGGHLIRLGSASFCEVGYDAARRAGAAPGESLIWFRAGGSSPVAFRVGQTLRSDAAAVVEELRDRGLRTLILSGDRAEAVAQVAERLGVAEWRAGLSPTQKIAMLKELKLSGCRTLMIGDGLNDAPALAAAHVSISPVTAVHMSQAAADAVFLGERLAPVTAALDISRKARRIMDQNLWVSSVYNVIAVPIAVAGLVTPLVAAVAMSSSSVVVTLNALRLRLAAGKG